jgi:hypothetical protein
MGAPRLTRRVLLGAAAALAGCAIQTPATRTSWAALEQTTGPLG